MPISSATAVSREITRLTDAAFPFSNVVALAFKDDNPCGQEPLAVLYGPFGCPGNMLTALINGMKKDIDEEKYVLTPQDEEIIVMDKIKVDDYIANEKAEIKAYVGRPTALFNAKDFIRTSQGLAKAYNKWLGREAFTATDFIPRNEDFPTGRDVDPNNRLNIPDADRHNWMTISEYIERVCLRVAAREKDGLEKVMQRYVAANTGNNK